MDSGTLTAYNIQAAKLTESYESANLSAIHALLLRHLPEPQTLTPDLSSPSILDLGCGSGRDAAFLHARGYQVTALDASPAMLKDLAACHPELAGHAHKKYFHIMLMKTCEKMSGANHALFCSI